MRNSSWKIWIAAICLLVSAGPADARFYPGDHMGYVDYGGYGGVYLDFSLNPGPQSMGMQPSAPPITRPQPPPQTFGAAPTGGQANRDWWFQYQARQMAAQRADDAVYAAPARTAADVGLAAAPAPPKANTDIIKWPALLQRPMFASRRAEIEAPYRRSKHGLSVPTAADYRMIARTAEEMKAMLGGLLEEGSLDTNELNQAEDFLDRIEQQAREQAEHDEEKPQTPKS